MGHNLLHVSRNHDALLLTSQNGRRADNISGGRAFLGQALPGFSPTLKRRVLNIFRSVCATRFHVLDDIFLSSRGNCMYLSLSVLAQIPNMFILGKLASQ